MRNEKSTAAAVGAPLQTLIGPQLEQPLLWNKQASQRNANHAPTKCCAGGSIALGCIAAIVSGTMMARQEVETKGILFAVLAVALFWAGAYGVRTIRAQAARPTSAAQDNKPVAPCESDADHCESGVTTISSNH